MTNPMTMEKKENRILQSCGFLAVLGLFCLLLTAGTSFWLSRQLGKLFSGSFFTDRTTVYMSQAQIKSIRDIGQWELVCINDEEFVDTVRRGIFSNDQLVRIYYGTLRLGLDLSTIDSTCAVVEDGHLRLTLPDVTLLDDHFIDEARTRSFFEQGKWSGSDRNALYERARQKMMARAVTKETLDYTRVLAEAEVRRLMEAMGYSSVTIRFGQDDKAGKEN